VAPKNSSTIEKPGLLTRVSRNTGEREPKDEMQSAATAAARTAQMGGNDEQLHSATTRLSHDRRRRSCRIPIPNYLHAENAMAELKFGYPNASWGTIGMVGEAKDLFKKTGKRVGI
jgi:hypothetical protein